MAVLTEPTIIRDDDNSGDVIFAAFFENVSATNTFVCSRFNDDVPFWVAQPNRFIIGDQTNLTNKEFVVDTGATNKPFLRYNVSASAWELSDDGVTVNRLGVTQTPTFSSLLLSSDLQTYIDIRAYHSIFQPVAFFRRARGTQNSPAAVQAGDELFAIMVQGYHSGGAFSGTIVGIRAYAAENFTPSAHGAYLMFETTPTGSTARVERMRITASGVVQIHSTANPCLELGGGLKIGTLTGALFASSGLVSALAATAGSQYLRRNASNTAYEWAALTAADLPNHASRHEAGGPDPITGPLDANARVGVRINTGATTYRRRRINFIAGSGISLSFTDDPTDEEVDVTVGTTGLAPVGASYVVMALDGTLTNERQLAVGDSLTITDGGPNSTVTLNTVQDIRTTATPTFANVNAINTDASTYVLSRACGAYAPRLILDRSRGTASAPTAVQSGDSLGELQYRGYDGAAYSLSSFIQAIAAENWSTTARGSHIRFFTTPTGSTSWVERMRIGAEGTVAIYTQLLLQRDGNQFPVIQRSYYDTVGSIYYFDRARGSSASPAVVQPGDLLGGIQFRGWNGSSWSSGAFIGGYAVDTFSSTASGGRLAFWTTPSGSTSQTERMRIEHDGVVYIYSTANPCLNLSGGLKIGTLTGALFASSGTVSALAATGGSQYLRRNAANTAYEWAALTAADLPNHATRHEVGGPDPITGNLDANARVGVRINTGATTYRRRRINFIAGSGVSLSFADDATDEEVDVTISASGGAPVNASYVVIALDATLNNERQLAVGPSLTMTDGGSNSSVTLNTIQDIRTTAAPTFAGLLLSSDGQTNIDIRAYSATSQPVAFFRRARGTQGSPAAVQAGDELLAIVAQGHYGGGFSSTVGAIRVIAAENFTSTAQGTHLAFETTPTGSTTRGERMRITAAGNVEVYQALTNVVEGTGTSGLWSTVYATSSGSSGSCNLSHARGTRNSPSALLSGDNLGKLSFWGHTGTGWVEGAAIIAIAAQNFGTAAGGTDLVFFTTANNTTSYTRRMRITSDGVLSIDSSPQSATVLSVGGEALFNNPSTFWGTNSKAPIVFGGEYTSNPTTVARSLWYLGRHFMFGKAAAALQVPGVFAKKMNSTSTTTTVSYFVDTTLPANTLNYPGCVIVRARGRIVASGSVTPTITFTLVLGSSTVSFNGATLAMSSGHNIWWELVWYVFTDGGTNSWKAHAMWIVSGIIGGTTGFAQVDAGNSRLAFHTLSADPTSSLTFRVGMNTNSTSATIWNDYATVEMI